MTATTKAQTSQIPQMGLRTLFGVVLPIFCLWVELVTSIWKENAFDPLPTVFHIAAVATVIVANLLVIARVRPYEQRARSLTTSLCGLALGVNLVYAVAFLPSTPLAFLGILVVGLGLLPLTPILSLFVTWSNLRYLTRSSPRPAPDLRSALLAALVAIIGLVGLDLANSVLRRDLHAAADLANPDRAEVIRELRESVDRSRVTTALHSKGEGILLGQLATLFGIFPRSEPDWRFDTYDEDGIEELEPARESDASLYYRIFGETMTVEQRFGRPQRRLVIDESRVEGDIDPLGGVARLAWTFSVRNDDAWEREGRIELRLPGGGVVDQAELWLAGRLEPVRAAVVSCKRAEEAYVAIAVRERKDPLLVSRSSPDHVSLRFSPVPPWGRMRFRIGLCLPLELVDATQARLLLPAFECIEHEWFEWAGPDEDLTHELALRSTGSVILAGGAAPPEPRGDSPAGLDRSFADRDRPGLSGLALMIARPDIPLSRAPDPKAPARWTRQEVVATEKAPGRALVVVEASRSLASRLEEISEALDLVPASAIAGVLIAGDSMAFHDDHHDAAARLSAAGPLGGVDGDEALAGGLRLAREHGASCLVWVHGEQPFLLRQQSEYEREFNRQERAMPVLDYQAVAGWNAVSTTIENYDGVRRLRAADDLSADLARILRRETGLEPIRRMKREVVAASPEIERLPEASNAGSYLRAYEEVEALAAGPWRDAVELASRYRLVSSVTSAVCLETQEQLDRFDLEAGAVGDQPIATVPTVPEADTWAMILVGLVVVSFFWLRSRAAP